jgi:hypothetical protein
MSFHSVVAACLHPGTAAKEKGKSVRIDLKKDETVLLFRTDSNEAKAYLGIKTASDFVYFYMKDQHTPKLVFVELKGSDLAKAAEQLQATIGAGWGTREIIASGRGRRVFRFRAKVARRRTEAVQESNWCQLTYAARELRHPSLYCGVTLSGDVASCAITSSGSSK